MTIDTLKAYNLLVNLYMSWYAEAEKISLEEFLNDEEVSAALYVAMVAIDRVEKLSKNQFKPANARKKWSADEDRQLVSSFDRCTSINALAAAHQRTEAAILDRLKVLGKR